MRGGDLRIWLREETGALHDRLDSGMSALDLSTRTGLGHFLLSHAYGLNEVQHAASGFAQVQLGLKMPDYLALVQADLLALRQPVALPAVKAKAADGPGACYVLLGSRLGMKVLRQRGYWQEEDLPQSAYMEDQSEKPIWTELLAWLARQDEDAALRAQLHAGATRAFTAFETGLSRLERHLEQGSAIS